MKLSTNLFSVEKYRYDRELVIAKEQIEWHNTGNAEWDRNDFIALLGNYRFRCERMDRKNWWMAVYDGMEEIANESGFETEEIAKEACIQAYVNHILKK